MLQKLATLLAYSYTLYPYRGYGRLNHIISRFLGHKVVTRRIHNFDFSFELFDPYWNLLLAKNFIYEPEVEAFLRHQLDHNPIFIDCGANYGFWTLFALGRLEDRDCISIEASPKTFEHLKRNVELNDRHPRLINRAISSSHDNILSFETSGRNHAGASISGMKTFKKAKTTDIRTTNLRNILRDLPTNRPVLIKLDVEGAEIDAIKGLGSLAYDRHLTIVYEEVDKFCKVTTFLQSLDDQRWCIFNISPDGSLIQIDYQSAREIASRANGPTNFVATNFVGTPQESTPTTRKNSSESGLH